jgi:hypothetical protein
VKRQWPLNGEGTFANGGTILKANTNAQNVQKIIPLASNSIIPTVIKLRMFLQSPGTGKVKLKY